MTGAYAHEWPGHAAWARQEGRGCGHGERGGGGPGRGGYGRGGRGGRGGRDAGFPFDMLMGWAMARGRGPGGPGRGGRDFGPEDLERIEELIAMRRMRGRGPSPFRAPGRGPRGRGRRRRGDVRLAILRLLAEEPRNGYQLMQTLEERSHGQWRPSPGSVYPTLSQLEDEALIRSTESDGGRRFEITDAGRESLTERAGEPDPWTPETDADEHAMSEFGPLVIGIAKAVWQVATVGDDGQRARAAQLLAETGRQLYGILAEAPGDDADEGAEADVEADSDDDTAGEPGHSEG